nr:MAG TPA: hypothetical protein [Caudoviricetes sp.]
MSTHAIADIFAIRTTTTTIQPNIFSLLSLIHLVRILQTHMVKKYFPLGIHKCLQRDTNLL